MTKTDLIGHMLLALFFGVTFAFCTYFSSVPVGEPNNEVPRSVVKDDDLGPINRELGLGTNEIDDFLGL